MAAKQPAKTTVPLTLDQINAIDDRAPVTVHIEQWGGDVQIRALTLQQINECSKRAQIPERGNEVHTEKRNGWYLVEGMLSPTITIDDAEKWLTERSAGPVTEILAAIMVESGLAERSVANAKSDAEGSTN